MDNQKKNNSSKKSNVVMFIFLIIVVICLGLYSYLRSNNKLIDYKNINVNELIQSVLNESDDLSIDEKTKHIDYDYKDHPQFAIYNNMIIECTKDKIIGLGDGGKEEWYYSINMSNPVIKTGGSKLLIADINGNEFHVFSGEQEIWEKKIVNKILNADINKDGFVSLIQETDKKGYKCEITVYDMRGLEVITRNIADYFVYMANVISFDNENYLITNGIDSSGASANTIFEFYDLKKPQEPFSSILLKDDIFPITGYLYGGAFFAASDKDFVIFDEQRNEKSHIEFAKDSIYGAKNALDKYVIVAVKNLDGNVFSNSSLVKGYDKSGNEMLNYSIDDKIVNIETFSDIIAVNTGRQVYFINTKGKLIGQFSSKSDILEVHFYNKLKAMIVTKENITMTKVTR